MAGVSKEKWWTLSLAEQLGNIGSEVGRAAKWQGKFKISSSTLLGLNDRFVIDGNGNVGIGTTGPNYKLDVNGSLNASTVAIQSSGANQLQIHYDPTHAAGGVLQFTAPAAGADANISTTYWGAGTNEPSGILIKTASGGNQLYLKKDGNIGIGTTGPSGLLHLSGADWSSYWDRPGAYASGPDFIMRKSRGTIASPGAVVANDETFSLRSFGYNNAAFREGAQIKGIVEAVGATSISSGLSFYTGDNVGAVTEKVRIDKSGNVGIGTTGPSNPLHVVGAGRFTANVAIGGAVETPIAFDVTGSITTSADQTGARIYPTFSSASTGSGTGLISRVATAAAVYTMGNAYSIFVQTPALGAGSAITNNYGVYIGNQKPTGVTNGYGIYQDTSTNLNYFAGNVGIGTTTPNNLLDIYSTTKSAIGFSGASGPTNKWTIGMDVSNGGRFSIASSTALGTTDRLVIDGNGNVGIGTTGPNYKLEVNGTSGFTGNMVFTTDNTYDIGASGATRPRTGYFGTSLVTGLVTAPAGINLSLRAPASQNAYIGGNNLDQFLANGSSFSPAADNAATGDLGGNGNRFRNGYFGTSIQDPLLFGGTAVGSSLELKSTSGVGTTDFIKFTVGNNGGTEAMRIINSGNVGIGTTVPEEKLHVSGGDILLSNTRAVKIENTSGGNISVLSMTAGNNVILNAGQSGATIIDAAAADSIIFQDGGVENMRIIGSGNVGIGTTSPIANLDIFKASGDAATSFTASSTAGVQMAWTMGVDLSDSGKFKIASSTLLGLNDRFVIDGNGNVGIGTTGPGAKLDVSATNAVTAATQSVFIRSSNSQAIDLGGGIGFGGIYTGTSEIQWANIAGRKENGTDNNYSGYLQFATRANGGDNTEKMRITSTGNVGIGTTTPWVTLAVAGRVALPNLSNNGTGYYACINTAGGGAEMATSTTACGASSIKYKENVADLSYGLEQVLKLRPVSFDWKKDFMPQGTRQIGFIAEEVEKIVPEIIGYDRNGAVMNLDYAKLTSLIVNAVQEIADITGTFKDRLIAWLGNAANGITKLFAKEVHTDTLCVKKSDNSEVCVTGDQLSQLLAGSGGSYTVTSTMNPSTSLGSPAPTESSTSTATTTASPVVQPTATTTTEVVAEPTATSTPTSAPAPAPAPTSEPTPEPTPVAAAPSESTPNP